MPGGPQPRSREERRILAQDIARRILARRGQDVRAVGIYGSVAQGRDGPYSDLEMIAVLRTAGEDFTREWTPGPWKAEVNFMSQDLVLAEAQKVDELWPITHGAFVHIQALHDPEDFFPQVGNLALAQGEEKFQAALRELIVGDLYELVGKVRNARHAADWGALPFLAVHVAFRGALLQGLAHRHLYASGASALRESLILGDPPQGHKALVDQVIQGKLDRGPELADLVDQFWQGVEKWAASRGLGFEEGECLPS